MSMPEGFLNLPGAAPVPPNRPNSISLDCALIIEKEINIIRTYFTIMHLRKKNVSESSVYFKNG
jgi:hypothetical protein